MGKKMCKNSEEINQGNELRFECAKCHQKATKEKHLCKPKPSKKDLG
jgi:hypothetical protein